MAGKIYNRGNARKWLTAMCSVLAYKYVEYTQNTYALEATGEGNPFTLQALVPTKEANDLAIFFWYRHA